MFQEGTLFPQDTLRSLWTSVPPASRAEADLVACSPPPTAEGLLLGQLDSGLAREGGSKKKSVAGGMRTAPWLLRQRATSRGGARPPCAQHTEDRSWGQRGTRAPSPERGRGTGGKSKSVLTAGGGGGLRRRREAAAPAATAAGGSRFHHADERHGLRAGRLGYPDAGKEPETLSPALPGSLHAKRGGPGRSETLTVSGV